MQSLHSAQAHATGSVAERPCPGPLWCLTPKLQAPWLSSRVPGGGGGGE